MFLHVLLHVEEEAVTIFYCFFPIFLDIEAMLLQRFWDPQTWMLVHLERDSWRSHLSTWAGCIPVAHRLPCLERVRLCPSIAFLPHVVFCMGAGDTADRMLGSQRERNAVFPGF